MNRRHFLQTAGMAAAATTVFSSCNLKPQKPNFIFFIADDMYRDMFNCLPEGKGKNLTPNLDWLAREGVILHNQYVVSPVCTPSRFNCLTGNYASRARNENFVRRTEQEEGQTVIQWNSFITQDNKILPHYLKEFGYQTGMVGKNHVIEAKGLHHFPDYTADPEAPDIQEKVLENYKKVEQAVLNCGFDYAGGLYHNNPNFIGLEKLAVQNMDWITQAGLDFIDQAKDQPFFLYFATTIPHQPQEPERSWQADPRITAKGIMDKPPEISKNRKTLAPRIKEAGLEGTNRENILWLDDALGALIGKLEEHKLIDNTIIFFFNDHGQKAKGTLYQGGVLNPGIIWKKDGFACGSDCHTKILNVDFAPTILEYAGAGNSNADFDGNSFKTVLESKQTISRESLYFELGYARAVIKGDYKYYAVRYPDYAKNRTLEERQVVLKEYNDGRRFRNMLIVNYDPQAPYSHLMTIPGGGQAENETYGKKPGYFDADQLYNIQEDPDELNNLADNSEFGKILDDLKAELKSYIADLPGSFDI